MLLLAGAAIQKGEVVRVPDEGNAGQENLADPVALGLVRQWAARTG